MRSLEEIRERDEEHLLNLVQDSTRPIVERVKIWQGLPDRDFGICLGLLCDLVDYTMELENQIQDLRKLLRADQ